MCIHILVYQYVYTNMCIPICDQYVTNIVTTSIQIQHIPNIYIYDMFHVHVLFVCFVYVFFIIFCVFMLFFYVSDEKFIYIMIFFLNLIYLYMHRNSSSG